MSRVLANILGTAEPALRQQIDRLERAAGLPGADIRLTMEIVNQTRSKIRALGLDSHDTTGPELYSALRSRLKSDEVLVRASMNMVADGSPKSVLESVVHTLNATYADTQSFVVKQSKLRAVLKKLQPKATMKKLGYRSMDSMLKHEPVAQLLAAASITESADWQRKRLEAYAKLKSSDFETRKASFLLPTAKQWPKLAEAFTAEHRHNILSVPELGTVVVLPLEHDLPGLAITTMLLCVSKLNDMRSLGSYLKLQQVRPDFGQLFSETLQHDPVVDTDLAGQTIAWKAVHWFYGNAYAPYHPDTFQPHVQPEDLEWHDAEALLTRLHPALEFWQGTQLLALLDGTTPVSLNLLDVCLSACNELDYASRIVHTMRETLGKELMARYLHHENLQNLLLGKLDDQLAPELAFEV